MSRARLVITAVVVEGRSQAEVARSYGVSPGWVSKLVARYRAEGDAAFEPRSRRPKTSPNATPEEVVEQIVRLRESLVAAGDDAGPETIRWHLRHRLGISVSAATISRHLRRCGLELQALLDTFVAHYNDDRPHRSLPESSTPATAYRARPKAIPGDRSGDAHDRVRTDRVDKAGRITLRVRGRLHHIGLGRTLTGTPVLVLVHDLEIRVADAATGELLRSLTLDPTRDYQPTGAPKGPTRRSKPPS